MSLLPGVEQQTVNPTEEWILLVEEEEEEESKDFNYVTYNSQNYKFTI